MTEAVDTTNTESVAPEATTIPPVDSNNDFTVPSEYADKGYMKDITSNDALFKQFDSLNKLMGDRGAFIPKEGATEEQISEFIDKLDPIKEQITGKFLKAPESYEFSDLELPEGVELSDDLTTEFSDMAKELGLTNAQADGIRKTHITQTLEREQTRQDALNEEFDTLGKAEWGDQYETKLSEAIKLMEGKLPQNVADELWNAKPSVLIPVLSMIHAGIQRPDSAPSITTSQGESTEQLVAKRKELRKAASANPNPANMEAFRKAQEASRGK